MYDVVMNDLQKPETIRQANAISRAIYDLNANARRLVAMAMAELQKNGDESLTVSFSLRDFISALGMTDGYKTRLLIQAAAEECVQSLIKIHYPNDDYEIYSWFEHAWLNHYVSPEAATGFGRKNARQLKKEELGPSSPWDTLTLSFNKGLSGVLKELKKDYAKLDLMNFGKLQSKYAIRFYELAMSYAGFEGKDGNRRGEWYCPEMSLAEIRLRFDIPKSKYPRTGNFRNKVIDHPIAEINDPKNEIGIRIEPEYKYQRGRFLQGVVLHCQRIRDERNVTPATETEREEEKLRAEHPDEWEALKAEGKQKYKTQPELGFFGNSPDREETYAEGYADDKLREKYPEINPPGIKGQK